MQKFNVTLTRQFTVEVEADDLEIAVVLAREVAEVFPAGVCKLLSVEPAAPSASYGTECSASSTRAAP